MDKNLFAQLTESMQQAGEILRGERAPSREFNVDAERVMEVRKATGLSQTKFAEIIDVPVRTLQNWEQGRRVPTGPAKAFFRVLSYDPKYVMKALSEGEPRKVTATSMRVHGKSAKVRTTAANSLGARGKVKKAAVSRVAGRGRHALSRG